MGRTRGVCVGKSGKMYICRGNFEGAWALGICGFLIELFLLNKDGEFYGVLILWWLRV